MTEENETNFKITDRRKYNADGSPRDYVDDVPEVNPPQNADTSHGAAEQQPVADEISASESPEGDPSKVLSFSDRKREQPQPQQAAADRGAADEGRAAAARPLTAAEQAYSQTTGSQPRGLPEATFISLINMLAVEAAMHLGLIETPGEAAPGIDLEAARHMIDMLGVLEQKTRGNLSPDEDKLLENILADLRMQYVALSRSR
jgi:hypothetical protein